MKNKILAYLLIFSPFLLHAQVDLLLKLDIGSSYCVSTTNKTTILQTIDEVEQKTINIEKCSFCYRVLEDLDSLYLVETMFISMSQELESLEGKTSFSSGTIGADDVTSNVLKRIVNKPFLVWIRKDYTWKETKGLDSLVLHISDDYKLPPETKKYLDSVLLEMIKEFTRNDADLTSVMYGSKKIIPGEVWTTSTYTEHVVPTNDSCTYYLAETGGDLLQLKGTGLVTSTKDQTQDGDEITSYDLKGNNDIVVTFFKDSFWMKNASLITELQGNTIIKNIKTGESRFVPTKISTESTIEGRKF